MTNSIVLNFILGILRSIGCRVCRGIVHTWIAKAMYEDVEFRLARVALHGHSASSRHAQCNCVHSLATVVHHVCI